MPYEPRTREDILKELMALVVARSALTDVAEGSVLSHILGAISEDLEGVEFSLKQLRDSFVLEFAVGEALDLRVSELPGSNITRNPPKFAKGSVLRLKRSKTSGALTIPKGTRFGRTDTSVTYRTTADVTFADGDDQVPTANSQDYVPIIAEASGVKGNCSAGVINKVVSSVPGVSVIQEVAITGGSAEEADDEFRSRAQLYLASLVRCQPAALIYTARSFISSEGIQFVHASVFEDPERPGYVELIVDDGTGLQDDIKDGALIEGTAPTGGQVVLYFEAPAAEAPRLRINTGSGFVVKNWLSGSYPAPVLVEERGLMYLKKTEKLDATNQFKLDNYKVYTGAVAELQKLIEGDASNPFGAAGYRASGTRVRVRPPEIQFLNSLKLQVTFVAYTDVASAKESVSTVVQEFITQLGPGDALRFSQLTADILNRVPEVLDCIVQDGEGVKVTDSAVFPSTPKTVLRLGVASFQIVPIVAA